MAEIEWLTRTLPDSFWQEAGHHSESENTALFAEIPESYRSLAYAIITSVLKVRDSNLSSCQGFRQFLFLLQENLIDEHGIDLRLPYYWYADGVMIEPELIVRVTNGIIGWRCDESVKGCLMEGECRYHPSGKITCP